MRNRQLKACLGQWQHVQTLVMDAELSLYYLGPVHDGSFRMIGVTSYLQMVRLCSLYEPLHVSELLLTFCSLPLFPVSPIPIPIITFLIEGTPIWIGILISSDLHKYTSISLS
jgi:hypothetical protein